MTGILEELTENGRAGLQAMLKRRLSQIEGQQHAARDVLGGLSVLFTESSDEENWTTSSSDDDNDSD